MTAGQASAVIALLYGIVALLALIAAELAASEWLAGQARRRADQAERERVLQKFAPPESWKDRRG